MFEMSRGAARLRAHSASWLYASAFVFTLLSGCGGGGDGGPNVIPPPSVPAAIAITTQPTDQTVVAGDDVVFAVVATGDVTYRWQTGRSNLWQDISSANSAQFRLAKAQEADSGAAFRVVVSSSNDPANTLTSSAAMLTVRAAAVAPSIEIQPSNVTLQEGQAGSFAVTAAGTSVGYQWQRSFDGVTFENVAGATLATLSLVPTFAESGALYRVQLSNSLGTVTSNAARLTVTEAPAAPTFVTNPPDVAVAVQQSALFTVVVLGKPAPALAWQTSPDGTTWTTLPGETAAQVVLPAVTLAQNGTRVRAVATNASGTVQSGEATLTVNAAPRAPSIVRGPADLTDGAGGSVSFNAEVDGVPRPSVQWQLSTNGGSSFANINGATDVSYQWQNLVTADNGKLVRLVAQNASGTVTSSAARLTVLPGPAITLQPQPQSWRPGLAPQRFQVEAAGTGVTYQWQMRADARAAWTNVPAATTAVAKLTPSGTETSVRAAVTGSNGGVTYSDPVAFHRVAWVTESPAPTIDSLYAVRWVDANVAVAVGTTGTIVRSTDAGRTFTAVRESAAPLGQWLRGLAVGSSSTLVASGDDGLIVRSVDGGQEWVTVRPAVSGTSQLNAAAFTGSHFVVAGAKGAILRSADQGATWQTVPSGRTDEILSMAFRGNLGFALTYDGALLRSANGGASWAKAADMRIYPYDEDIVFLSDTAILVTQSQSQAVSTDSGLTWQFSVQDTYFGGPGGIVMTSPTKGIALPSVANEHRYTTVDGGRTWTRLPGYWAYPTWQEETTFVRDLDISSSGILLAVGSDGFIVRSDDGGTTWTHSFSKTSPTRPDLYTAAFGTSLVGVGGGKDGLFQTVDGGVTWRSVGASVHQGKLWRSVVFVTPATVLAYDESGRVAASTDSGATWTVRGTAMGSQYAGRMSFGSPMVGLVATDQGVQRTNDGGVTWQTDTFLTSTTVPNCYQGSRFGSATVVIVHDCSGMLYRSADGGLTWRQVNDLEGFGVRVGFADVNTIVAVGRSLQWDGPGVARRSTDGGQTWTPLTLPGSVTGGFNVWFVSPRVGYIESWGQVLRTIDAGLTWTLDMPRRARALPEGISLPDGSSIIVSQGGVLLRRGP